MTITIARDLPAFQQLYDEQTKCPSITLKKIANHNKNTQKNYLTLIKRT
jgi:hypothetical protein